MRVTLETKNATRKCILEVGQRLFAKHGFEATTTRDIAREAQIAVGTLFNYFPTKESIVECLVTEAYVEAAEAFAVTLNGGPPAMLTPESAVAKSSESQSLEEELFAHVAVILRKFKPYRKYLPAMLETSLSPLAVGHDADTPSLRVSHLETVSQIISRHAHGEALSTITLQLYWTLYTGVLTFWAKDRSPRQEDTLALLDQSLAMFVGWLTNLSNSDQDDDRPPEASRKRR